MNSAARTIISIDGASGQRPVSIANWLLSVALLVFIMVIVGGITRLTESGLSITEWKPIMGAIPPLNEADWLAEFNKYKQIPEYIEITGPAGMTLADFKFIYFWEWIHRLLGRVIGLAFAVPFVYFAVKRAIPRGFGWRLTGLLALGGLQGLIGWWMVTSGLAQQTDVSHFRLAVHLLLALFILACLVWTALDIRNSTGGLASPARMTGFGFAVTIVLFLQLLFGAYVAGLNAGYVSNTWPLMNDRFIPDGIDYTFGLWAAVNHDPYLVHFIHRWWAWVVVGFLVVLARKVRRQSRMASVAIHIAFGTQILLGIATVMTGMDIVLAVLHQAVGALVVATTAWGVHVLGRANRNSIRS